MDYIYAISNIHGYLEPLDEVLSLIDLSSNEGNKVIIYEILSYVEDTKCTGLFIFK